jgi:CRISPR-associated protein Csm3
MAETVAARALVEKVLFGGTITALTGLHIGGNDAGLAIGGADKLVVRDPRSQAPYIPGSSLKGKMRSLLEKTRCARDKCAGFAVTQKLELGPCRCGTCLVCIAFGVPADDKRPLEPGKPYAAASRALVRDAFLSNAEEIKSWPNLDFPFTEIKTEVSIDRLTSKANPRQFERVPPGARFSFEIALTIYEGDNVEELQKLIEEGLGLVADDTIGGQGSRGYGQVEIRLQHRCRIQAADYADATQLAAARGRNELVSEVVLGGRLIGANAVA